MTQSALKDSGKTPFEIQPFREKATLEPPNRWENWRTQLKLAILAREGIVVDLRLADPPSMLFYLPNSPRKTLLTILQHNQNEKDAFEMIKQRRHERITGYVLKL